MGVLNAKTKLIIHIPTVDNPNPETTWRWLSFGKNKAIVKFFDAIKKFAEEWRMIAIIEERL
jgi:glycerophosphoryl diester phosphodiesterase